MAKIDLSQLVVRDFTAADEQAIVDIHNSAIPGRMASGYLQPVTVEQRRGWLDAHSPDHRPLLVAVLDKQVIGWGCLSQLFQREAYDITAEASVYVTPEAQGSGVATAIFESLFARCPKLGVENIVSLIFGHNEPSIRLHRKLGFEDWGFMPAVTDMDGTRRDVVILGKKIEAQ